MKAVMDSSSLISISETCLMDVFGNLVEKTGADFFIPKTVEEESVLRPLKIKRFELNALRIKKAIQKKWIKVAGVDSTTRGEMNLIASIANNVFFSNEKAIKLIQAGEAEALALLKNLGANLLVVDERTTRMLIEKPMALKEFMERRQGIKIKVNEKNLGKFQEMFKGIAIVRSVELIALAFERGLVAGEIEQTKQALEACLFALKYRGCAVSAKEILDFMR